MAKTTPRCLCAAGSHYASPGSSLQHARFREGRRCESASALPCMWVCVGVCGMCCVARVCHSPDPILLLGSSRCSQQLAIVIAFLVGCVLSGPCLMCSREHSHVPWPSAAPTPAPGVPPRITAAAAEQSSSAAQHYAGPPPDHGHGLWALSSIWQQSIREVPRAAQEKRW